MIKVPLGGNAFVEPAESMAPRIEPDGVVNWIDALTSLKVYVAIKYPGELLINVSTNLSSGKSVITLKVDGRSFDCEIDAFPSTKPIGTIEVKKPGYLCIEIFGKEKEGLEYGRISSLIFSGSAAKELIYVKDNIDDMYYWGRRGPSTHFNFQLPKPVNATWLYSEINVPIGYDAKGFYSSTHFNHGYFGMQVKLNCKWFIFSVWDADEKQKRQEVLYENRVVGLGCGTGIIIEDFQDKGTGLKSHKVFEWKAGQTYRFALNIEPQQDGHTRFTLFIFSEEHGNFELFASFARPKTQETLTFANCFLENFYPQYGNVERKVFLNNQWILSDTNDWHFLNKAFVTVDSTGQKQYRLDYHAGIEDGKFYLRHDGFFDETVILPLTLTRSVGVKPDLNTAELLSQLR